MAILCRLYSVRELSLDVVIALFGSQNGILNSNSKSRLFVSTYTGCDAQTLEVLSCFILKTVPEQKRILLELIPDSYA